MSVWQLKTKQKPANFIFVDDFETGISSTEIPKTHKNNYLFNICK